MSNFNKGTKKSTLSLLVTYLKNISETLGCSQCSRKVCIDSKCKSCSRRFCAECLFQMQKTKMCKLCNTNDSLVKDVYEPKFIDDLIGCLVKFELDTMIKIFTKDFFFVESLENLQKLFIIEKKNVFSDNIITSTPNRDNIKKINFNSELTIIAPNKKEKNKTIDEKIESISTNQIKSSSKRKLESISESFENIKVKKVKDMQDEDEIKENVNTEEIIKTDENKQPVVEKLQNDEKNRNKSNSKISETHEKTIQKSDKTNDFLCNLANFIETCKEDYESCINLENLGKIKIIIEPFKKKEIKKEPEKIYKDFSMQTEFNMLEQETQTEKIICIDQSISTDLLHVAEVSLQTDNIELKEVEIQTDLIIDECSKLEDDLKSKSCITDKSYSMQIEFDEKSKVNSDTFIQDKIDFNSQDLLQKASNLQSEDEDENDEDIVGATPPHSSFVY